MTMSDLVDYYRARALEYEAVYAKPERQYDLRQLQQIIPEWFEGRHVLEVACGTGYWTRYIATRAAAITGCDLAEETLDVAIAQKGAHAPTNFVIADAFALEQVPGTFDACFVGFFWSHIPRDRIHTFLSGLHRRLSNGGRVLIVDNRYVAGSNWPITRTDSLGNTYQDRTLSTGAQHEVLKNFPSADELETTLTVAGALNLNVRTMEYFWFASYEVAGIA